MDVAGITSLVVSVAGVAVGAYYARKQQLWPHRVEASQAQFRQQRLRLADRSIGGVHCATLHLAADRRLRRVGATDYLTRPDLLLQQPIALSRMLLRWTDKPTFGVSPALKAARHVLPWRTPRERYERYSAAMWDLSRPQLFVNAPCYRVVAMDWAADPPELTFGACRYFDMIDSAEALAHEFGLASARRSPARWRDMPARRLLRADIFDLDARAFALAIPTLTLIRRAEQPWSFLMHWRDPEKVAMLPDLFQVIPAGVFQPATDHPGASRDDLDLWHNVMREYAEELLGAPDAMGGVGAGLDYARTEPYRSLQEGLVDGRVVAWCFGLGIDPLTLTVDLLTAVLLDEDLFESVFGAIVPDNEEGRLILRDPDADAFGIPFTRHKVTAYLGDKRLAPSAAACLHLAWEHRAFLAERPPFDHIGGSATGH